MTCAYDGTVSYTDEALVATTDLDFQFATNSADFPGMGYFGQSRMPDGSPRKVYHVLNGKSFPDTDVIDVRPGDSVLVRSVNAGVTDKSMSLLGLHQTLLARNASQYTDPQTFTSPLVGPGETADLAVQIPANAAAQQRYALIDAGRQMNHGNSYGFGGALTFLNVWPPAPVVVPPVVVPPGRSCHQWSHHRCRITWRWRRHGWLTRESGQPPPTGCSPVEGSAAADRHWNSLLPAVEALTRRRLPSH